MDSERISRIIEGTDTTLDKLLLELAIQGVTDAVRGDRKKLNYEDAPVTGVFVTITSGGRLRGCIGFPEGYENIYSDTYEAAILAATEDPRFPAIKEDELQGLDIEVSVLGPLVEVDPNSWDGFVKGRHGIVIRSRYSSGLLLPQVAEEYDLDWISFLKETCLKAGLKENCYTQPDVKVYVFSGRKIMSDRTE